MNKPAQRLRLGLVALTLIIAAHPANARAANEMQDAQSASNLTPVIQLDGTATREDTINGTRIVLLGASYETVFTGDPDPKKAIARRFPIVYLVALIQTRSTQADQGSKAINPGVERLPPVWPGPSEHPRFLPPKRSLRLSRVPAGSLLPSDRVLHFTAQARSYAEGV